MADQPARGVETAHAMAAETAPPSKYASAQQLLEFMDKNKATAKHVFGMMDVDGDRGVSIDEIGQLLHNIGATHEVGEYNEQTVDELFRLLDIDGDGMVTFDEFVDRLREADHARRMNAPGMHRRDVAEYESLTDKLKLLSPEEMQAYMRKLDSENSALKHKLGQVSKVLLKATADAAKMDAKWSGGAAGAASLCVSASLALWLSGSPPPSLSLAIWLSGSLA
eukprot:COSAG03_NODE_8894_length_762_cov_1.185520_1_plen_222_part_10